jgi:hypothetical protein
MPTPFWKSTKFWVWLVTVLVNVFGGRVGLDLNGVAGQALDPSVLNTVAGVAYLAARAWEDGKVKQARQWSRPLGE